MKRYVLSAAVSVLLVGIALVAVFVLFGCGATPTEAAETRAAFLPDQTPVPRATPIPTSTPNVVSGPLTGVMRKPTPCFVNPFDACGTVLRPTLGPGTPTPTPNMGNWPTTIPGTIVITGLPTVTPTPAVP